MPGVGFHGGFELSEVGTDVLVSTAGDEVPYDVAFVVPPHPAAGDRRRLIRWPVRPGLAGGAASPRSASPHDRAGCGHGSSSRPLVRSSRRRRPGGGGRPGPHRRPAAGRASGCRCSGPPGSTPAASRRTTSRTSATRRRSCGPTCVGVLARDGRGRGDQQPQRHRRRRRADPRPRTPGPALRRVRPDPGVPVRPRHGRARRRTAPRIAPHARAYVTHVQQLASALLAAGARLRARRLRLLPRRRRPRARPAWTERRARAAPRRTATRPGDPLPGVDPFDVAVWRPSGGRAPGLAEPVGLGPPRLARRVRRDGGGHARAHGRRPGRRRGPHVPAPRLPGGHGRGRGVGGPVRPPVLHVGAVAKDGAKMAKSTGNLILVGDLLERRPPRPCG